MAGRNLSKSPQPPVRRSSRQSTPTRDLASPPPPTTRTTRSSAIGLPSSASTPSLASLVPPTPDALPTSPRGVRRSASTRAFSPRAAAKVQRPPLPTYAANKQLVDEPKGKGARLHKVKTQTLHLGDPNGTITIARVKCPVPKGVPGHIIKRFDTDAVSASSLFRAAFPLASEIEEANEMRWVSTGSRGMYGDTKAAGSEYDESKKLSGTWVPSEHAATLAKEYGIARYAVDLIEFAEPTSPSPEGGDEEQATPGSAAATDDSPAARSPRAKRARVSSPLANKSASSSTAQALSGATSPGISILQTLATDESGAITETTEVKVDVPVAAPVEGDEAPQFDDAAAAQIAEAQKLVDSLKREHVLADLAEASHIPDPHGSPAGSASKKRALEADEDELPQEGTLADALGTVDNRSFFAKLFRRRNNTRRKVPTQASRETRALPAPRAPRSIPEVVVREEDDVGEGRRWAAGFGLAVAVGATAAAPYLFG
ncbi:hypothetical protein JCM10450v2_002302 [Rhodotorula kratochvilovae]